MIFLRLAPLSPSRPLRSPDKSTLIPLLNATLGIVKCVVRALLEYTRSDETLTSSMHLRRVTIIETFTAPDDELYKYQIRILKP